MLLCLQACAVHGSDPKAAGPAEPASKQARGKGGEPCTPAMAIVDEQFRPVDLNRNDSVMSAAGHPVFICTPLVRATSGVVFDDVTHAPIAGAVVTIEAWQARAPIGGLAR